MTQNNHQYITVAYDLYSDNSKGIHELIERAPADHPFQFITGLGVALDAFEQKIAPLSEGETFDFTLSVDEAYGPYVEEHVITLSKDVFTIDGRFDDKAIYPAVECGGAVFARRNDILCHKRELEEKSLM